MMATQTLETREAAVAGSGSSTGLYLQRNNNKNKLTLMEIENNLRFPIKVQICYVERLCKTFLYIFSINYNNYKLIMNL